MVLSIPLRYTVHMIKHLAAEQPVEHSSLWEIQKPVKNNNLSWLFAKSASYSSCCMVCLMQTGEKREQNASGDSTGEFFAVGYTQLYSQDV